MQILEKTLIRQLEYGTNVHIFVPHISDQKISLFRTNLHLKNLTRLMFFQVVEFFLSEHGQIVYASSFMRSICCILFCSFSVTALFFQSNFDQGRSKSQVKNINKELYTINRQLLHKSSHLPEYSVVKSWIFSGIFN